MSATVEAMVLQDLDGAGPTPPRLVAGGLFVAAGSSQAPYIAIWDGADWLSIPNGPNDWVHALAEFDPDAAGPIAPLLVVGGRFTSAGGFSANRIASWNGVEWSPFGAGFADLVHAIASFDSDGDGPSLPRMVAGGGFLMSGATPVSRIAQWDGVEWMPLGGGVDGFVRAIASFDPDGSGPIPARLVVGGAFSSAGGTPASFIAQWDGSTWSPLGTGVNGEVRVIRAFDPDGPGGVPERLVVGGDFTLAGSAAALHVATWDGTSWAPVGSGTNKPVYGIDSFDPDGPGPLIRRLIVCGDFTSAGGNSAKRIAQWDGAIWLSLGTGLDTGGCAVQAFDPDGAGPQSERLAVGGFLNAAGGQTCQYIAQWNGAVWAPMSDKPGFDFPVYAMAAADLDGSGPQPNELFAGGNFTSVFGASINRIARWDGHNWSGLGSGVNSFVRAIAPYDPDGSGPLTERVIVGGWFTEAGGAPAPYIAGWDGAAWSSLGTGMDSLVLALSDHDPDGGGPALPILCAGGLFTQAGSSPVAYVAQWTGADWLSVGTGFDDGVESLASFDPDGAGPLAPRLIAGGYFNNAGPMFTSFIAQWDGIAWAPLGTGMSGDVRALLVFDVDGAGPTPDRLIAGGSFPTAGDVDAYNIALWDGVSWSALGTGMEGPLQGPVEALASYDPDGLGPQPPRLVAAGLFTSAGGTPAAFVAQWDGSQWLAMDLGLDFQGRALAVFDPDGVGPSEAWLCIGGDFSTAGSRVSAGFARWGRASSTWGVGAGGAFDDPSRWYCVSAPSRFDRLYFDHTQAGYMSTAFQVNLPASASTITADALRSRTDVVTLNMLDRSLSLTGDAGLADPSLIVGELPDKPATLILRNTLSAPVVFSAQAAIVGDVATISPLTDELRVRDSTVTLDLSGDLYIGRRANKGVFTVQFGGDAIVDGAISVGTEPGAVGEVRMTHAGSMLLHSAQGRSMAIGQSGTGTWSIGGTSTSAGAMAASQAQMDTITIGANLGGIGTATVAGAGSLWTIAQRNFYIGYSGIGTLRIEGGALLDTSTASELIVARFAQAAGSLVEIKGTNSRWIERSQALSIGAGGTVRVNTGATLDISGINVLPGGTLTGDGMIGSFTREDGQRISPDVFNFGVLDPAPEAGSGASTLTILGNYRQIGPPPGGGSEQAGSLRLKISGTAGSPTSDTLAVAGDATLGGGLIVERDSALTGAISAQGLQLLNADAGISGFFDVAFLPPVGQQGKFFRAEAPIVAERGVSTSVVLTIEDLADLINTTPSDVDNLGGAPAAAVLGDFNSENGIDLAVALPDSANPTGAAGDLIILYNSGSTGSTWNGWSIGAVQYPVGVNPSGIDAAELDGAPGLDLVISNEGDDNVRVLSNNGTIGAGQSFTASGTFSVGDAPSAVVARDLDLDGFADVAVSNSGSDSVSLLQNRGIVGTWQGLGQTLGTNRVDLALPAGAAPRGLCAARLNAGNDLEIAVANTGTDSVSVISNDPTLRATWGGGRFQIQPPVPTGPRPVTIQPIANPDEDKWDALGTVNFDAGSISVILNNTDGVSIAFRPHVEVPIGDDPSSLVGVDLDNDGDEDLAIVATGVGGLRTVRVLRNDTRAGDTGATYSLDNDITSTANPLLVLAGNVNPTVDSRRDLVVLGDNTALAGARGTPQSESQVVLNTAAAPPPCAGDADAGGTVNFTDILTVLANFGGPGPDGDADHNNIVNFNDVLTVLANFGAACP